MLYNPFKNYTAKFIGLLFVLLFFSVKGIQAFEIGPPKKDTLRCMKLMLKTTSAHGELDRCSVLLYKDNVLIDSAKDHLSRQVFELLRDRYYTVKFSKPGYIQRSIVVNTKLPPKKTFKRLYENVITIYLPEKEDEKKFDDFYLDFPIAIIKYNAEKDCFEHIQEYTDKIKEETLKKPQKSKKSKR